MRTFLTLGLILLSFITYSQNKPGKELPIRKAVNAIKLDGELTETDWQAARWQKIFF